MKWRGARWIDIDTDAALDGAELGTVEIDPMVCGAHLEFRFRARGVTQINARGVSIGKMSIADGA